MPFAAVTLAEWRAQVEKELAGKSFDKVLVHETLEGVKIAPLYAEAPPLPRDTAGRHFRICMRAEAGIAKADLLADVNGGADALWIHDEKVLGFLNEEAHNRLQLVFGIDAPVADVASRVLLQVEGRESFLLGCDPIAQMARGTSAYGSLADELAQLAHVAKKLTTGTRSATAMPGASAASAPATPPSVPPATALVSTLAYHDAGAGAADEIAFALSTGVRYLQALTDGGLTPDQAARQIALQVATGRDTFLELCKLRALRIVWNKVLTAAGAKNGVSPVVHAVGSMRTLTVRDPWVNMLRATTQTFSAVLGGADLVTPSAFDAASGAPSALGRRVARHTPLILREESSLGKVADPAGGAYYFDSATDSLAREAWNRFRALEKDGGIVTALESGRLAKKLEDDWKTRLAEIARRKTSILGVSEFAHLEEKLPRPAPPVETAAPRAGALHAHRDSAPFEALRSAAESKKTLPEAVLVTLGPFAESRPRAGFAAGFFSAGGIRTRETTTDEKAYIACLCGSDERYATDAIARVRALKAAGCTRVLLAGRPGAQEAALREAGASGFIFVGCDLVAILADLLDGAR
ncbi:MAG: methylmalonyl-CoA mutase family protein [Polyangiaceae bacterium]